MSKGLAQSPRNLRSGAEAHLELDPRSGPERQALQVARKAIQKENGIQGANIC